MSFSDKVHEPIWIYPKDSPDWKNQIVQEFNIHSVTAQILISRGFNELEDIHKFLYAKLPDLHSPNLFSDMDTAVDRIVKALRNKETILIYGDNDVDGMTAAALLTEFLRTLDAKVHFFVPNRNSMKKSIVGDALEYALKHECSLIVTVDCGITASKEIENVISHDIDVIITDHHEPTSKIPHCIATLNPKLINSTYPNRDITGVGVAFKLAHAITNIFSEMGDKRIEKIDLKDFLDLVALGTISDMGSLVGENRILVRYGLTQLRQTKRIGLAKLFQVCELNLPDITPVDIASKVAPRLNSLGRIADPRKGIELLLIRDVSGAEKLAKELDLYNIKRQQIEREASDEIEKMLEQHPKHLKDKAIVLYSPNWHPGIIAIISARIAKRYNRPTVIISIEDGLGKGSIRTIPEFPLLPVLKETKDQLLNFGGHDFAAGLTIDEEQIPTFKKIFTDFANERLKTDDIISKLRIDARTDFDQITFDFMESLSLLAPFGNENPPPILYTDAHQLWPPKIVGNTHLKFFLEQGERMLEGIGFGMSHKKSALRKKNQKLRVAFTPRINSFLNKASIQLQIKDFKS